MRCTRPSSKCSPTMTMSSAPSMNSSIPCRPERDRQHRSPKPDRFRFLATYIAGSSLDVTEAPASNPHTNGQFIFVSAGGSVEQQRREMLVQAALLGAGGLDPRLVKGCGHGPRQRAATWHSKVAGSSPISPDRFHSMPRSSPTASPAPRRPTSHSRWRRPSQGRRPPEWFGVIKPSRFWGRPPGPADGPPTKTSNCSSTPSTCESEDDDDEDDDGGKSVRARFSSCSSPLFNNRSMSDYFRKMFGGTFQSEGATQAPEMTVRSIRRVQEIGRMPPVPAERIQFTDDGKPVLRWAWAGPCIRSGTSSTTGTSRTGAVSSTFRATPPPTSPMPVSYDDVLRRRRARVGLGPRVLRGRADEDDLDIEALIDLFVDLQSGFSAPEHVYLERRKLARNLGVLILIDASGSAVDADSDGLAVHDHQRRAADTLAVTLEELGDRVAVYAFRSQGRHAVHLPAIKTFDQNFGAVGRARLNQLEPASYTRLGAGIRGAGEVLKNPGRHAESAAARPFGRLPLRRRLRRSLRGSRRQQGPRSSAPTALPACACPSALPRKPMCSNASSAPPASPALRPWPT